MIRKSVQRFSEKIMLKQQAKARWRFNLTPSRLVENRIKNDTFLLPGRGGRLFLRRGWIERAERAELRRRGGRTRRRGRIGRLGSGRDRGQIEATLAATAAKREQQRRSAQDSEFRRSRTDLTCHARPLAVQSPLYRYRAALASPAGYLGNRFTFKSRLFPGVCASSRPARAHWPAQFRHNSSGSPPNSAPTEPAARLA